MKEYLKVKAKRGESLLLEVPLFVSRNSAKGQKAMVCLPIGKARISQVQRDFKKWVKMSGIESNLSPHALRHTVGTRLLKEFKNAKLVQRYLGHSDAATTLTPLEVKRHRRSVLLSAGTSNGVEVLCACLPQAGIACPAVGGVFPEDLEEAAEMLAER